MCPILLLDSLWLTAEDDTKFGLYLRRPCTNRCCCCFINPFAFNTIHCRVQLFGKFLRKFIKGILDFVQNKIVILVLKVFVRILFQSFQKVIRGPQKIYLKNLNGYEKRRISCCVQNHLKTAKKFTKKKKNTQKNVYLLFYFNKIL